MWGAWCEGRAGATYRTCRPPRACLRAPTFARVQSSPLQRVATAERVLWSDPQAGKGLYEKIGGARPTRWAPWQASSPTTRGRAQLGAACATPDPSLLSTEAEHRARACRLYGTTRVRDDQVPAEKPVPCPKQTPNKQCEDRKHNISHLGRPCTAPRRALSWWRSRVADSPCSVVLATSLPNSAESWQACGAPMRMVTAARRPVALGEPRRRNTAARGCETFAPATGGCSLPRLPLVAGPTGAPRH